MILIWEIIHLELFHKTSFSCVVTIMTLLLIYYLLLSSVFYFFIDILLHCRA